MKRGLIGPATKLQRATFFYTSGIRIECHNTDPEFVPLTSSYYLSVYKGTDCHQVILSMGHNALTIWVPLHTEQAPKVPFHGTMQLHRIEAEPTDNPS
jgi:hypothetical protein